MHFVKFLSSYLCHLPKLSEEVIHILKRRTCCLCEEGTFWRFEEHGYKFVQHQTQWGRGPQLGLQAATNTQVLVILIYGCWGSQTVSDWLIDLFAILPLALPNSICSLSMGLIFFPTLFYIRRMPLTSAALVSISLCLKIVTESEKKLSWLPKKPVT